MEVALREMKSAIMDAAERRIQVGGFGGFSFRDLALDVGIKSSSVHYHFPTKEALAAAVVRRWAEGALEHFEQQIDVEQDPAVAWAKLLRDTAFSAGRICPCTVLGATSQDLPQDVALEVKAFLAKCVQKLEERGLSRNKATAVFATLTGALVLANALGDSSVYDRAVSDILVRDAVTA